MMDNDKLKKLRKDIYLTAESGGIGHLASAYSSLEIIYTLYCKGIMKFDPKQPLWAERDRFILSKGHASLALYTVMAECGFFEYNELFTFSKGETRLGGEPNAMELPGAESTTGSLGHGVSFGVGTAAAFKSDNKDNRVYVLIGDGESQEGSIWEAAMAAKKLQLDNLTVILDFNKLQKMGTVSEIMDIDDWKSMWEAFGWEVTEVDGHDTDELTNVFNSQTRQLKPHLIIANTVKGKGVSIMESNPGWHWRMPRKKELKVLMEELNITQEEIEHAKGIHK